MTDIANPSTGRPTGTGTRLRFGESLQPTARHPRWPVGRGLIAGGTAPPWRTKPNDQSDRRPCPMSGLRTRGAIRWRRFRRDEIHPASFTPDELWLTARPCGVERVVLVQMSFYGFDNRYMLEAIRNYPGVFAGIAVIDDDAARPQDEMAGWPRRNARVSYLSSIGRSSVARWARHGGDVACGADDNLAMCHLVNPDALPAVDRMCGRFPETPVVIDHFRRIGSMARFVLAMSMPCAAWRSTTDDGQAVGLLCPGAEDAPYADLVPMNPSFSRPLAQAFDVGDRLSLSDQSAHV